MAPCTSPQLSRKTADLCIIGTFGDFMSAVNAGVAIKERDDDTLSIRAVTCSPAQTGIEGITLANFNNHLLLLCRCTMHCRAGSAQSTLSDLDALADQLKKVDTCGQPLADDGGTITMSCNHG